MKNFFGNHFRSQKNLFIGVSFYSTNTNGEISHRNSWNGPMGVLYRQISPIGDPKLSVVPVLDKWVQDGQNVNKSHLVSVIKELRYFGRYKHALEISMWMTDKRYFQLTYGDVAIRLDLIAKVHGVEQAENYFNNVPRQLKSLQIYNALLNCYAHEELVEKAEALMQQMKDMGLARSILAYNALLNLYLKTGSYEKMGNLLHEMEEKGISNDKCTYAIQIGAYAANSDMEGIDKILSRMETDPQVMDWNTYSTAANGCIKAGLVDKALLMLKKSEELILTSRRKSEGFQHILTQYAAIGKKDEVLRLWELYGKQCKVYNRGYISMITSLLKFDDIESAEKIFKEWESQDLNYDNRIPNPLISACCSIGLFEKAESLLKRVIEKGGKPNSRTWHYLATGYFKHNQMQKAAEAIKEEISVAESFSKLSKDCLAACLEYLKGKGDLEGAEEIITLLRDKCFLSVDIQDRLLNYIKDGESNSQLPIEILADALDRDEETS
ncbi:pentatricopeptide repeat-containing protein At2g20710, mitochondrial-like isoform X1 [Ziziphus jujuba]|uniref:Pentatricopeptide repeat-containing protein At2g20710, mitochondrial-like isoform X1 n=1 Tax=Ziziphus jujuba TaxID=326968 RepID=A0ABM3ZVG0_ZIZJJ|nr:pentatricopeptide repeat-containing protein At2g20710, mitochondrial-like isoform X1 [Ziziphus jujuba]